MQKILIVDDNPKTCSLLCEHAKLQGFECIIAKDGYEALELLNKMRISIVLLDIVMEGMDGIALCRTIRRNSDVPIIIISEKGADEEERILGLNAGADDYIAKPFGIREVMARINAILRRIKSSEDEVIKCSDLVIDMEKHITYVSGQAIQLTKKEQQLLLLMAKHPGRIFTRDELMDKVCSSDSEASDRSIDTHIKRLRGKINKYPHEGFAIKTIWGVGYKLDEIN